MRGNRKSSTVCVDRAVCGRLSHLRPLQSLGPEILSKFVGESEKNIRDLFADAEKEAR